MQLIVTDNSSIKSIQRDFTELFPFLKIEFIPKWTGEGAGRQEKISSDKNVRIFYSSSVSPNLFITDRMTIWDLQVACNELLGLAIQVFRKAGNVWVETHLTEHWTLSRQNEEGRYFSTPGAFMG